MGCGDRKKQALATIVLSTRSATAICPYFGDKNNFKSQRRPYPIAEDQHVWMEWRDMGFSVGNYGSVAVSCM